LVQERSCRRDHRSLQRREVDQPSARARRRRAVSELLDACGATESRRAAHHAGIQCHSGAAGFLGLPDQLQQLMPRRQTMAIEQTSLEAHALAVESRTQRGRWHSTALACASMMASGFAGLAYQI